MDEAFKIYLAPLRGGGTEKLDCAFAPDFLEVDDPALKFTKEVLLHGEAYITDEQLVIHFGFSACAVIPCSICNTPVEVPVHAEGLYHVLPMANIRAPYYDMHDLLRESVLLETPAFAECSGGTCPERESLKDYLKTASDEEAEEEEGYHPFSEL